MGGGINKMNRLKCDRKHHSKRRHYFSRNGILCALLILCSVLGIGGLWAYAEGSDDSGEVDTASAYVQGVEYYVALNGTWQRIDTGTELPGKKTISGKVRFYTTPEDLEKHYSAFGFEAKDYTGENIFPHTAGTDTAQIWADLAPTQDENGTWIIPLATTDKIYVYYLPGNLEGNVSYFTKNKSLNDADLLSDNMFYTVIVSDPDKKAPELSGMIYLRSGASYTITLPIEENYGWECVNQSTMEKLSPDSEEVSEDGKKVTFTFDNVKCPIKIQPENPVNKKIKIIYNAATVKDNLQMLSQVSAGIQEVETEGQIYNQDTYTSVLNNSNTNYKVLTPDNRKARVKIPGSSKDKKYWYVFKGWQIAGTGQIVQPGDVLDLNDLAGYEINGELYLNATWSGKNENGRIGSANFYVNKACEIADNMTDGVNGQAEENFTKSIFVAKLNEADPTPVSNNDYGLLAPNTSQDNAHEVDEQIRGLTKTAYKGVTIEEFPSDEEVLASLRKNYNEKDPIKVNGEAIPKEDLTATNFKVRWYTVKYEHSDGWHVDGILVAKAGMLVVKKSFTGSAEAAINELKDTFYISVTHQEETEAENEIMDYKLVLNSADAAGEGETGYTTYDADTHTYTWVLRVRDYRAYQIKEQNYKTDKFDRSEHTYRVRNIVRMDEERESVLSDGWQNYSDAEGITVVAEAYPDDAPTSSYQTVELRNLYINSYYITLNKMDSFTFDGMKSISFAVSSREAAEAFQLYHRPGTNVYASKKDEGFTETVAGNVVETDNSGMIYLKLPAGTYLFEEQIPAGYQKETLFKIVVKEAENGSGAYIESAGSCDENGKDITGSGNYVYFAENSSVLQIKDQAEELTTVTAQANMGDVTADSVKVELWCNGAKLEGQQYTQRLNVENDWSYVWENLPLYVNGEVAQYKIREIAIGDTAYDSNVDGDGYGRIYGNL